VRWKDRTGQGWKGRRRRRREEGWVENENKLGDEAQRSKLLKQVSKPEGDNYF